MRKLLKAAKIEDTDQIQKYEQLLDNFNLYVSYDKKTKIQYTSLGKIFKQPQLLSKMEKQELNFLFPRELIKKGSKIILYGAGDVGRSFSKYLITSEEYQFMKWVDKKYEQYREYGYPVSSIESILGLDYDYILIAIYNENIAEEIKDELVKLGINEKKVIWIKPRYA